MDLSVWSQELINYLTAHMDTEREVLKRYAVLAERAEPGHVRYLVELILADEVRHHQLFGEMINALRAEMDQREISPRLPDFRPGDTVIATSCLRTRSSKLPYKPLMPPAR